MSSVVSDDSLHRSSRISFAPGTKEGATILHGVDEDLLEVDEVGELLSAPAGQAFPSFSLDVDPFEAHVSREATPALDAHVLPETQIPEERIAQFEEDARVNPWLVDDTGKAWTSTHIKIIALISLYGRSALKSIDNETWVLTQLLRTRAYTRAFA